MSGMVAAACRCRAHASKQKKASWAVRLRQATPVRSTHATKHHVQQFLHSTDGRATNPGLEAQGWWRRKGVGRMAAKLVLSC